MVLIALSQALFGLTALVCCGVTARAVLRRDPRAHFFLTLAGAFALVFFVCTPVLHPEMIGVSLLAVAAGILLTPSADEEPNTIAFDSTATRRR